MGEKLVKLNLGRIERSKKERKAENKGRFKSQRSEWEPKDKADQGDEGEY